MTARIYIGETDAQRMGFAKTSKISAPLIIQKQTIVLIIEKRLC